jgi:large subunit ribosomal protein L3
MIGLLAKKIGMTQLFDESGRVVPVTLLTTGPCKIVQVKTPQRDGYAALQIGFGTRREKCQTAPVRGHLKKHNATGTRLLREVRVDDVTPYQEGQDLTVTLFEVGSRVDVIGTSKGRGFAGVVKRHHFSGGRETHGCVTHKQPAWAGRASR